MCVTFFEGFFAFFLLHCHPASVKRNSIAFGKVWAWEPFSHAIKKKQFAKLRSCFFFFEELFQDSNSPHLPPPLRANPCQPGTPAMASLSSLHQAVLISKSRGAEGRCVKCGAGPPTSQAAHFTSLFFPPPASNPGFHSPAMGRLGILGHPRHTMPYDCSVHGSAALPAHSQSPLLTRQQCDPQWSSALECSAPGSTNEAD